MDFSYKKRDNQPPVNTGQVGIDLTSYVGDAKVTASFDGRIAAGATAIATTLVLSQSTAARLINQYLGTGIRARINRTNEWILITAVVGQNATVTRAQLDSDGIATVGAPVLSNDELFLVPLDAQVMTAILDPADTTNQTAICTFTSAQTGIPAGTYALEIRFTDGTNRITWPIPGNESANLIIADDPNGA